MRLITKSYAPRFRIVTGSTLGIAFYEVQKLWLRFFWIEKHRIYVENNDVKTAYEEAVQVMTELQNIEIAYYQQSRNAIKTIDLQGLPCVSCSKPSDTATEDGADMCWECMAGFLSAEYSGLKTRATELAGMLYPHLTDEDQIVEILDPVRTLPAIQLWQNASYAECNSVQTIDVVTVDDLVLSAVQENRKKYPNLYTPAYMKLALKAGLEVIARLHPNGVKVEVK